MQTRHSASLSFTVSDYKNNSSEWRRLKDNDTGRIRTDLHTAQIPVPSVNISERSSVHRAGRSHLQLERRFNKRHQHADVKGFKDTKCFTDTHTSLHKQFAAIQIMLLQSNWPHTNLLHLISFYNYVARIGNHLCPREEASEAEDVTAAVRHGELASGQNAEADGTLLRLLSIRPVRRALAT